MRMEWNAMSRRSRASLRARAVIVGCLSLLVAPVLLAQIAAAQQTAPPPEPNPPAAIQPTTESRGLFEAIGRWFDQGAAGFRSHMFGAKGSFDDLNQRAAATGKDIGNTAAEVSRNAYGAGVAAADVTRDAVGAVAKLPMSRVVQGRERCAVAPNGAPDCLTAAETLCRKQGYSTGKSVDFTSAESCPVRTHLGGRQSEAECTTVTFISRAMCQ
jgi:hypothetical protein